MSTQVVRLTDPSDQVVAVISVAEEVDRFGGTVDLTATPPAVRAVFDEFEEVVNSQMFGFLDEVQAKLAALNLTAQFPDGAALPVADLQVYPTTGDISFKVAVPVV